MSKPKEIIDAVRTVIEYSGTSESLRQSLLEDFPEADKEREEVLTEDLVILVDWFKKHSGDTKYDYDGMLSWIAQHRDFPEINPSEFDARLNALLKKFEDLPKEDLAGSLQFYLEVVQGKKPMTDPTKPGAWPPASNCKHDCKSCLAKCMYRKEDWTKSENKLDDQDYSHLEGVIETELYMLDVVSGRKKFDVGNQDIKRQCEEELEFLQGLRRKPWKKSLKTADLENSLCDLQDNFNDTSHEYEVLGEAIEFLRTTEESWKPSQEQLEAVEIASRNIQVYDYQGALESLAEDLKKL